MLIPLLQSDHNRFGFVPDFFRHRSVWNKIYDDAVIHGQYNEIFDALMVATAHMKDFMMNQTRREDAQFF